MHICDRCVERIKRGEKKPLIGKKITYQNTEWEIITIKKVQNKNMKYYEEETLVDLAVLREDGTSDSCILRDIRWEYIVEDKFEKNEPIESRWEIMQFDD